MGKEPKNKLGDSRMVGGWVGSRRRLGLETRNGSRDANLKLEMASCEANLKLKTASRGTDLKLETASRCYPTKLDSWLGVHDSATQRRQRQQAKLHGGRRLAEGRLEKEGWRRRVDKKLQLRIRRIIRRTNSCRCVVVRDMG